LLAVVGVTMICNVPLNDALAAVQANAPEAASTTWSQHLRVWTAWHHLRTVTPLVSTILFMAALI
jgi:uncharacterized membrane protein